jgi:hypothetical protein
MKAACLIVAACLSLGVSGFVLTRPAKITAMDERPTMRKADVFNSQAFARYRGVQPRHWRYVVFAR